MEKIVVTVHVPTIQKQYDFFLPINVSAQKVFENIQDLICDVNNNYVKKEKLVVFDSLNGQLINLNNIIKFSGLQNGSHVLIY